MDITLLDIVIWATAGGFFGGFLGCLTCMAIGIPINWLAKMLEKR